MTDHQFPVPHSAQWHETWVRTSDFGSADLTICLFPGCDEVRHD